MSRYYQQHVNYGLSILLSRLNYIKFSNPEIYQYCDKDGKFSMECSDPGLVDYKLYFSYRIADNKELIADLEKTIKRLNQENIDTKDIHIKCANCTKLVCTLSLMFENKSGTREFELELIGFLGELSTKYLGQEKMTIKLFNSIRENLDSPNSLHKLDPDIFGFVCNKCNKSYCSSCWQKHQHSFDEGFFDDTRAVCPKGHMQMIQD